MSAAAAASGSGSCGRAPVSAAITSASSAVYRATISRSRARSPSLAWIVERAGGDHAGAGRVGEARDPVEHDLPEGGEHGLAVRSRGDLLDETRLEDLHPAPEEILLRREVVEDRSLGDVGRCRDLGHRDAVEAALAEEGLRRVGDQPARALLLARAKPGGRRLAHAED
jgi:hypothetical protein